LHHSALVAGDAERKVHSKRTLRKYYGRGAKKREREERAERAERIKEV